LAAEYPVPVQFVGMQDRFGQSGEPKELLDYYGMSAAHIITAAKAAAGRKK